ncbi:hypothetical protein DM01DRAFT_1331053 [Hesseltinella vesiculosa]|uniref:Uncharacterized protein n=1 Tax=Hesseltinella vesiculosa TaxID=101127 RepID=A0A1X2GXY8_9FUNG|nr:hypothetical protein DM01DRAFT_1331053 [Hesseltinella vesiculosa]
MNSQRLSVSSSAGLTLGLFGMVGLMISLMTLLPLNVYNMYLASHTALYLVRLEQAEPWWRFSHAAHQYYFTFLAGSVISSFIVICLVLTTCLRKPKSTLDLESNTVRQSSVSVWTNRWACLVFLGQISWAIIGNHLIWFVDMENALIYDATKLSVWILWLNYGILIAFSFLLVCASVFLLIGGAKQTSPVCPHLRPVIIEEMQQQETTPLLNKTANSSAVHSTSSATTTSSLHQ